jgi:hypothetical protein
MPVLFRFCFATGSEAAPELTKPHSVIDDDVWNHIKRHVAGEIKLTHGDKQVYYCQKLEKQPIVDLVVFPRVLVVYTARTADPLRFTCQLGTVRTANGTARFRIDDPKLIFARPGLTRILRPAFLHRLAKALYKKPHSLELSVRGHSTIAGKRGPVVVTLHSDHSGVYARQVFV